MRQTNLRLKVIGLVAFTAFCGILFLYLFNVAGGRLRLNEPYNARVQVPDSLNIVLNSDVRYDGVKIGRVRSIDPRDGLNEIKFEIEDEDHQAIYKDASVKIRTKTLVGETYVDLDPGTARPGEKKLKSGQLLPLGATAETVPLERILDSFDAPTRREIRNNLKGLGEGLDGHGDELNTLFGAVRPTVASGGRLMRVLEPQKREVAALLDQTGQVFDAFGQREQDFRNLVRDATTAAKAAASRDEQLKASIGELAPTLTRAQSTVNKLARFSDSAAPVMNDLTRSARDLTPAVRDLGPAARSGRRLFRELEPFLVKIDPTLDQLTPASRALAKTFRPLDAFLRQVNPAAAYLQPFRRDISSFFANTGALLSAKDVYGYIPRVHPMLGPENVTGVFNDQMKELLDNLYEITGSAKIAYFNPYPKPGTADRGTPPGDVPRVDADK